MSKINLKLIEMNFRQVMASSISNKDKALLLSDMKKDILIYCEMFEGQELYEEIGNELWSLIRGGV